MGRHVINLIGQRFKRLLVERRADPPFDKNHGALWHCRCDCGNECDVSSRNLRSGHTVSCGCFQKERVSEARTTHGHSESRLYYIWNNMIQRCTNPKNPFYKNYGGRGITVCKEWLSFEGFLEWAKAGYRDNLTIDRYCTDDGYYPENCHWATMLEQERNRSNNIVITHSGITQCLSAWAEALDISYKTLYDRIALYGWEIERALTTPVRPYHRQQKEERVVS